VFAAAPARGLCRPAPPAQWPARGSAPGLCCSSPHRTPPAGQHLVELVGEGAKLVATGDLDPLIERPGADLAAATWIARSAGEIPPSSTLVRDCRHEEMTSSTAVRQSAAWMGANATLSGSSTNTHHPGGSTLCTPRTSVPWGSRPLVTTPLCAVAARPVRRAPAAAPRGWCREDEEMFVGVSDHLAVRDQTA